MTQDSLEKLAAALAGENDGAHVSPELTRTRIMTRLALQRRKRRFRLVLVAPLFGLGLGSTALAALNADFRDALSSIPALFGSTTAPADLPGIRKSSPPGPGRSSAQEESTPALPLEASRTTVSEVQEPARPDSRVSVPVATSPPERNAQDERSVNRRARGVVDATNQAPALVPADVPPAPAIAADIGLDLYRQAHDAQFRVSNYGAALENYRAYLREHPDGVLSVEARYNAALCEVRLGYTEAARRSLTPFARGSYGSYRQEEARALLEALPRATSLTP